MSNSMFRVHPSRVSRVNWVHLLFKAQVVILKSNVHTSTFTWHSGSTGTGGF